MLFKLFSRRSFQKSLYLSLITMLVLMIIRSLVFSLKEHNSPLLPSGPLELFGVMLLRSLVMLYFAYTLYDAIKELVLLFGEEADKVRCVLSAISLLSVVGAYYVFLSAGKTTAPSVGEFLLIASVVLVFISLASAIVNLIRVILLRRR